MAIIVLDGPEAAGKTTLAAALQRLGASYVHWGLLPSDYYADTRYLEPLAEAVTAPPDRVTVWDRSWLSGSVYGPFQRRKDRLTDDPWIAEWLYGRAAAAAGIRVLVAGPSAAELQRRRRARKDPNDIPIDPMVERDTFRSFGRMFGWWEWNSVLDALSLEQRAEWLMQTAISRAHAAPVAPPAFAGPPASRTLVVGESRGGPFESVRGAWLPFTSRYTVRLARSLGFAAFRVGWSNIADFPPDQYATYQTVVACGGKAIRTVQKEVNGGTTTVIGIPHPSWLYRWGKAARAVEKNEGILRKAISYGEAT